MALWPRKKNSWCLFVTRAWSLGGMRMEFTMSGSPAAVGNFKCQFKFEQ